MHNMFLQDYKSNVYKISVEHSNLRNINQIKERYHECSMIPFFEMNWYRSANKKATKLNAILEVAKYFNIDILDVVAFGDDYNDIEMIQECGTSVVMENGINEVKEIADYTCESNDIDGVARWIEHYLL